MPPLEDAAELFSTSSHHSANRTVFQAVQGKVLALTPTNSPKRTRTNDNNQYGTEIRTARDGCIGAIMALVHYLSQQSAFSDTKHIHELHQMIPNSNHLYDNALRNIIVQYVRKLPTQIQLDDIDIIHMLVMGCWQALSRYAQIQYQQAYRCYHDRRWSRESHQTHPIAKGIGIHFSAVLPPNLHHHPPQQYGTTHGESIERALHHQIQMAEYVCTCQKEIILCTRSYEQKQRQAQQQRQQQDQQ
jgi:hypothetical protein